MLMRSFEAANIAEAMHIAREELGEDAVILSSDPNKDGNGVVVTFALDREDDELFDDTPRLSGTWLAESPGTASAGALHDEPVLNAIEDVLRFHAVPEPICDIITNAAASLDLPGSSSLASLHRAFVDVFSVCYRFEPLPLQDDGTRVILVGPPGVGKTITAAKLAAKMVVDNQPVRVISTDGKRAGGIDQLQAFTRILGVSLDVAATRSELKELLQSFEPRERVIIDSAGCNPYDFQELKELGEFAHVQDIEPVLVCAAGTDGHEATEIASVFSFLDIERVLISRTDCARHYGSLLSVVRAGDYAFSHVTSSARAMGDLQPMDADLLAQLFTQYQRERIAA